MRNFNTRSTSRFGRCVHVASEVANLLVHVRGRPSVADLFALSTKALDVGLRIRDELVVDVTTDPWEHFGDAWSIVPHIFAGVLLPRVGARRRVTRNVEEKGACAWEGDVHGVRVGWIEDDDDVDAMFVMKGFEGALRDILCDVVWMEAPSGHAVLREGGIREDELGLALHVATRFVVETHALIDAFLRAGERQSYLILGEPGTGKTTAIQHVVRALGRRSLRIPLAELSRARRGGSSDSWSLGDVVPVLRPEILIVDDIDRADTMTQTELLEFVDSAKQASMVFLASANHLHDVIVPLRRPGRFDEHIFVPALERPALEAYLGEERDVAADLEGWPIAYVCQYLKQVRVLGSAAARSKIPALKRRIDDARGRSADPFAPTDDD